MAYSPIKPCGECGREYNHVALSACPECNVTSGSGIEREQISPEVKANLDLIAAQKKTTHAVRATVIILQFFMLNLFLIGIWFIFGFSNNLLLVIINCLLWIIGAIRTLYLARVEFEKSE